MQEQCPFKAGEWVVYKPTARGRDLVVMTDLADLVLGQKYKIARIDDKAYVVVEGLEILFPAAYTGRNS